MANLSDYIIATLGSHSALQILKGAKDEGLRTLCVCEKGRTYPYKSYRVADEIIEVEHFSDFFNYESQLIEKKAIMIPHPSLINAIGIQAVSDMQVMYYGSKGICQWEFDRNMERQWLADAGLALPKLYNSPEEIDRAVIVKFHGAQGGHGYFIARSPSEFYDRMNEQGNHKKYVIQEYIVGVPVYAHYFYSLLNNELEIMSFDKRYESNADSIGRIAAKDQIDANINTSYTITGNIPIVVRESLLTMFFKIGDAVVESSRKLTTKGLYGPFCLEGVIDTNLNFFVFEISARIVAGTNLYTRGSPYSWLRYNEPMSTGRRVAREIKQAIESDRLDLILG